MLVLVLVCGVEIDTLVWQKPAAWCGKNQPLGVAKTNRLVWQKPAAWCGKNQPLGVAKTNALVSVFFRLTTQAPIFTVSQQHETTTQHHPLQTIR